MGNFHVNTPAGCMDSSRRGGVAAWTANSTTVPAAGSSSDTMTTRARAAGRVRSVSTGWSSWTARWCGSAHLGDRSCGCQISNSRRPASCIWSRRPRNPGSCRCWIYSSNVLIGAETVRRPSFCRRQLMRVVMSTRKVELADSMPVSGQSDGLVVAGAGSSASRD